MMALDNYVQSTGFLPAFKGSLETAHRLLFSQNGDALSMIYAGESLAHRVAPSISIPLPPGLAKERRSSTG